MECEAARFEIERQDDPQRLPLVARGPGVATPPQMLRVGAFEEATLLIRCLERPKRDLLLETSLRVGSRIVTPVAPRLSALPPSTDG